MYFQTSFCDYMMMLYHIVKLGTQYYDWLGFAGMLQITRFSWATTALELLKETGMDPWEAGQGRRLFTESMLFLVLVGNKKRKNQNVSSSPSKSRKHAVNHLGILLLKWFRSPACMCPASALMLWQHQSHLLHLGRTGAELWGSQ